MPIDSSSHDSPFGRWHMMRWSPAQLRDVVDLLWYFKGSVNVPRERVFPDGRIELIVHLGEVYRQVNSEGTEPYSMACIAGLLLHANVIEAPAGENTVLGIRLHPAGAYRLLGQPLHELADLTVDLRALLGDETDVLAARCAAAPDGAACLRLAADWIARRVCAAPPVAPAIAWAAAAIERQGGAVSVGALREQTGWSKTRFTSVFREQIGVLPKMLARIYRFRHALELVSRAERPLAAIALSSGYYDQSHFNAEFREISGFAPGEFRAATRFPASVNLAESR